MKIWRLADLKCVHFIATDTEFVGEKWPILTNTSYLNEGKIKFPQIIKDILRKTLNEMHLFFFINNQKFKQSWDVCKQWLAEEKKKNKSASLNQQIELGDTCFSSVTTT